MENTPYVKQFDSNGALLNPITVHNPYLHTVVSKRHTSRKIRVKNNHRGVSLVVISDPSTGLVERYTKQFQLVSIKGTRKNKVIVHYHLN